MKILFVYPNSLRDPTMPMGIGYLSALAKREGHTTALYDTTFLTPAEDLPSFESKVALERPDILGFSVLSHEWAVTRKMIAHAVQMYPKVPVIVGGPHATICPDEVIAEPGVTYLVRGEAETIFTDFVNGIARGDDVSALPNLWTKRGEKIIKNPSTSFVNTLDGLPFPDWSLFDPRQFLDKDSGAHKGIFETQRGCPYRCAYCINSFFVESMGTRSVIRLKSLDRAFEEMKCFLKSHSCSWIHFTDEIFILNRQRLEEFCSRYGAEIHIPFSFMLRPERVDLEGLRAVYKAGGRSVAIGIECGNEEQRRSILGRNVSNATIEKAFEIARTVGLSTSSFNILGFPGETRAMIMETIAINRKVRPDHMTCSVLFPYKGTAIYSRFATPEFKERYETILETNVFNEPVFDVGPDLCRKQVSHLRTLIPKFYDQPDWVIDRVFDIAAHDPLYYSWRTLDLLASAHGRRRLATKLLGLARAVTPAGVWQWGQTALQRKPAVEGRG